MTVPELTVVIPALNEGRNLEMLLPALGAVVKEMDITAETVVVDGGSADDTAAIATALGARVIGQPEPGYGSALLAGLAAARSPWVMTMDADLSHRPTFLRDLWAARSGADLVVASRYVPGGASETFLTRRLLSRILNTLYSHALSVPVGDMSSGFRLYRRGALEASSTVSRGFDALPEILTRLYAEGRRVVEVPFQFASRGAGRSHVRLARFAWAYLKTLGRLWALRNSVESADYDYRAFDSRIPLQRYWQRARHAAVLGWAPASDRILDVACGSSRILLDRPRAVGVDIVLRKLRFMRRGHPAVSQASLVALPFRDGAFDTVVCSQVVEQVADVRAALAELRRVLRPGGRLVLRTLDHGRAWSRVVGWLHGRVAPGERAKGRVTRFDRAGLEARLAGAGYEVEGRRYVGGSELVIAARRRAEASA